MVHEKYESDNQQDVAEFLLDLLDFLDKIYQETFLDECTPINGRFSIKRNEYVTCPDCSLNIIQPIATEKIFTCPAPREYETNVSVAELISRTCETETVERRCRNCPSDTQQVRHEIDEISDSFIVQISRFTNDNKKIRESISLEEELIL